MKWVFEWCSRQDLKQPANCGTHIRHISRGIEQSCQFTAWKVACYSDVLIRYASDRRTPLDRRHWWSLTCNRCTAHRACTTSAEPLVHTRLVKGVIAAEYTCSIGLDIVVTDRTLHTLLLTCSSFPWRGLGSMKPAKLAVLSLEATGNTVLLDCCTGRHDWSWWLSTIGVINFFKANTSWSTFVNCSQSLTYKRKMIIDVRFRHAPTQCLVKRIPPTSLSATVLGQSYMSCLVALRRSLSIQRQMVTKSYDQTYSEWMASVSIVRKTMLLPLITSILS